MVLLKLFAVIIPPVILIAYIYGKEKIKPVNGRLVFILMILGMVAAVISIFLEEIFDGVIRHYSSGLTNVGFIILYYLMVGFVEEGSKYMMLWLKTWKHPNFEYKYDGIVFSSSVAAGFAVLENVIFFFTYGLDAVVTRGVTAFPAHIAFSAIMGIFYSKYKFYRNRGRTQTGRMYGWFGLFLPMGFHCFYDVFARLSTASVIANNIFSFLFIPGLILALFIFIRLESMNDEHL